MQPLQFVLHQRRSKPDRFPFAKIFPDSRRFSCKSGLGVIELSIVLQSMNSDLKSGLVQLFEEFCRKLVFSLWNKVEGRAKPQVGLQLQKPLHFPQSSGSLDIMSQNKRKAFLIRPAVPPVCSSAGIFVDGPYV